jgi:TolB-like protein/tetratricopeptide (TPR) repeat protein
MGGPAANPGGIGAGKLAVPWGQAMDTQSTSTSVICFDDIRVELDGHRLFRAGQPVALEPKAFAVLRTMLQRPGHAFSRDELLDAAWGHRHVTPGVLVRAVGLIRRALGDESERYLQTVHGIGYRLVLPDPVPGALPGALPPPDADLAGTAGAIAPCAIDAASPALARRSSDRDPVAADHRPGGGSPTRTPPWRAWRGLAAVVGLAGFIAAAWVLIPDRSASPPAVPETSRPASTPESGRGSAPILAVLPLRAVGDDPRGADFAVGLSEELIGALARIDGLRVSARSASFPFSEAGLALPEVARRLGASHILEGSVRQDGERLRIALRLVDVGADRASWSESFDRSLQDIFTVQVEIARAVAEVLRLRLVLDTTPARIEDPELYRRFLLARQPHRATTDYERAEVAEADLRALLAEHPDYARAWGGLAVLQFERSLRPRADRDALLLEAEAAAARALALDPGQSDALAVIAGQACREQRWTECLAQARRVVLLAPSDADSRFRLGLRLAGMGYPEQALVELEAALAISPVDPVGLFAYGRVLDTLGRHQEAAAALTGGRSETARVLNALWRQDLPGARRLIGAMPSTFHWRASMLATVDALEDSARWPRALELIELSERTPPADEELIDYNFMRMWLPQRDFARDVAALDRVQRIGFASYQLVFWQPQSRELRQSPAFHAYLRDSGLLDLWRQEGWPSFCRPHGDGVACD